MRRINRCLNPRLIDICQRTRQLEELNTAIAHFLPPTLKEYCHVGSFNKGCLIIVVKDPAWGSQLRYILPELRDKLRAEAGLYQLSSIKISIDAGSMEPTILKKTNKRSLSTKTLEGMVSSADQCDYAPLKKALNQLAKHLSDAPQS